MNKAEKWYDDSVIEHHDLKIFKAKKISKKSSKGKEGVFTLIDSPNWVNIVPITTNGKIVIIEQFRHGISDFTIEIPGGLVDHGEDFSEAATRECIEETGYSSDNQVVFLAEVSPNPAFLNNKLQIFLWENCEKRHIQKFDSHEDIIVKEVEISEVKQMIKEGLINHSLVLNALFYYFLHKGI